MKEPKAQAMSQRTLGIYLIVGIALIGGYLWLTNQPHGEQAESCTKTGNYSQYDVCTNNEEAKYQEQQGQDMLDQQYEDAAASMGN